MSGVTIDITERKEAEERQALLAREVDHRARNALAVVQSIVRLTRADNIEAYIAAVEGRINALSRAHALLSRCALAGRRPRRALVEEELAPYRAGEVDKVQVTGPNVSLPPAYGAGTGAGAARTRHQRRQVRRVVVPARKAQPELAIAAGLSRRWNGSKPAGPAWRRLQRAASA